MLRRQKQPEQPTPQHMDTGMIGPLEEVAMLGSGGGDFFIRAVLFGTGELRKLNTDTEVYGLVVAGYQGLSFGDDGTYTARVASELPLDPEGLLLVERQVDEAVRELNPAYCAEFVGTIAVDEAAAMLGYDMKKQLGVPLPSEISWQGGQLTITG